MKYIVTGAAGFIGSHVAQMLLNRGHNVIAIDDFSSGLKTNLPSHNNLELVICDLANDGEVRHVYDHLEGADGVFHLAADARIQPSIQRPDVTVHNNVNSTLNLLEAMRALKIRKIVYSGSSSCYGGVFLSNHAETGPLNPLNAYAASKMMGETLCLAWANCYGLEYAVLRYFNVFGPRSPTHIGAYSPVIGLFFTQALQGKKLTIVGDGDQTRDFTWVDDVVTANRLAMETRQSWIDMDGGVFNIGTGKSISILNLARKINELCGQPRNNFEFLPARPAEAKNVQAYNALSLNLGVKYTPLDEALVKMKQWYEQQLKK